MVFQMARAGFSRVNATRMACLINPQIFLTHLHNQPSYGLRFRHMSSLAATKAKKSHYVTIFETIPAEPNLTRIVFSDNQASDFAYIWLRDNCQCSECVHADTKQKLIDTPVLDIAIKPENVRLLEPEKLSFEWPDGHKSVFDAAWLHRFGKHFQSHSYNTPPPKHRPALEIWDKDIIWKNVPEVSYEEFMKTDGGLFKWLDLFHKYGLAFLRGVPTKRGEIQRVAKRFAYVKETSYGVTFDVLAEPDPKAHLAYTGLHLAHHTDMNYREKSPGMQMLHCIKAKDMKATSEMEIGGKSFFADGFFAANWLRNSHPAEFHILCTLAVRFNMMTDKTRYSQDVPVICVDRHGDISEIHINNRTMGPLTCPPHLTQPFYHAYKMLNEKIRDPASNMEFNLVPGDLVAFNNRRMLHGRTAFDPTRVSRHLEGCYVDIDETISKYDGFLENN